MVSNDLDLGFSSECQSSGLLEESPTTSYKVATAVPLPTGTMSFPPRVLLGFLYAGAFGAFSGYSRASING